jgi:hypothetical protein
MGRADLLGCSASSCSVRVERPSRAATIT